MVRKAAPNISCGEDRCRCRSVIQYVRIKVFVYPVFLIQNQRKALRRTVCPCFDLIEYPTRRRNLDDGRAGDFSKKTHMGKWF